MFKTWGWYLFVVLLAIAAFWATTARAHDHRDRYQQERHQPHNSAPRFHAGPNSHPPHQHRPHHHRPSVIIQYPPFVYYQSPQSQYRPVCQRWDGWRQQYIYVPC